MLTHKPVVVSEDSGSGGGSGVLTLLSGLGGGSVSAGKSVAELLRESKGAVLSLSGHKLAHRLRKLPQEDFSKTVELGEPWHSHQIAGNSHDHEPACPSPILPPYSPLFPPTRPVAQPAGEPAGQRAAGHAGAGAANGRPQRLCYPAQPAPPELPHHPQPAVIQ